MHVNIHVAAGNIHEYSTPPPLINLSIFYLGQNCELNYDLFHALATRINKNILSHIFITFIYKILTIISIFF